ncbi:MAG: ABC-ATPase domain-containing protein [Trueperaceae bacterium]|nr:ABC-ATPase domain-containing protein [Trueperaceae bacterium]
MPTDQDLHDTLGRIDGRGYKAYNDIRGHYDYDFFRLYVDHVQGDPFAAPSKLRAYVDHDRAEIPKQLYQTPVRRVALEDYLARRARARMAEHAQGHRGSGKSGALLIDAGGQEILERTACRISDNGIELRLEAGLPARGRTVLGYQARAMLTEELPMVVSETLQWATLPQGEVEAFVACAENQEHIRAQLRERDLVAFVADGSVLPRESGASDRPLSSERGGSVSIARELTRRYRPA